MRRVSAAFLFCLFCGVVTASAQTEQCFENDGLKLRQRATFTITGNKVEGTFESGGYDEGTSAETFDFTGTKAGNLLTIKFVGGKPPYELPPGTKRIVWTLAARSLKIPTYGKNYNTNRYTPYVATYEKCKEQ
ncbi:MAG TPA: hypothetical protein VFA21_09795 [Pyrinomonadaceae bacterium]|jgi:hypothetical protein|nr:hypothetical protein [Pyrinomonadaceae bacterium]